MSDTETNVHGSFEEPITVKRGHVLFSQGEASSYLYIVATGSVGIFVENKGRLSFINAVGERDFIGEMSMFSDEPRSASAVALEDTTLIMIKKVEIRKVLKMCPEWVTNIMVTITDRLRNTVDVLREHRIIDELHPASAKSVSQEEISQYEQAVEEYRHRRGLDK